MANGTFFGDSVNSRPQCLRNLNQEYVLSVNKKKQKCEPVQTLTLPATIVDPECVHVHKQSTTAKWEASKTGEGELECRCSILFNNNKKLKPHY